MPGAGGNFLSRVCEQSHCTEMIELARYPKDQYNDSRDPVSTNWMEYERAWTHRAGTHNYTQGHHLEHDQGRPIWLRVTVTNLAEWRWAVSNAFWKNSHPFKADGGYDFSACSDPGKPAQHYLSLRDMWQWGSLRTQLIGLGLQINPHMQELWQQWRGTWSPRSDLPEWQQECEQRWDGLRPAHVT